jgi:hypothetical protein
MIRAVQARVILPAAIVVTGASTIALRQNFTGRVTAHPTSDIRPTRGPTGTAIKAAR